MVRTFVKAFVLVISLACVARAESGTPRVCGYPVDEERIFKTAPNERMDRKIVELKREGFLTRRCFHEGRRVVIAAIRDDFTDDYRDFAAFLFD